MKIIMIPEKRSEFDSFVTMSAGHYLSKLVELPLESSNVYCRVEVILPLQTLQSIFTELWFNSPGRKEATSPNHPNDPKDGTP